MARASPSRSSTRRSSPALASYPFGAHVMVDFLNVVISLADIWEVFLALDSRFVELASYLGGARALSQDLVECLI
ncbi:hypothetical protein ACE6H2_002053 [Prunus campanulata]